MKGASGGEKRESSREGTGTGREKREERMTISDIIPKRGDGERGERMKISDVIPKRGDGERDERSE